MSRLREMKCVSCRAGEPTVTNEEIDALHSQIPEWQVKEVDGLRVRLAHGSPRKINEYLYEDRPDATLGRGTG